MIKPKVLREELLKASNKLEVVICHLNRILQLGHPHTQGRITLRVREEIQLYQVQTTEQTAIPLVDLHEETESRELQDPLSIVQIPEVVTPRDK